MIITAAAQSSDPVELAGEISMKKGKVVVVGMVIMNIPVDLHYYRKEIDIRMSCSYGPGRYDVNYEEMAGLSLCLCEMDRTTGIWKVSLGPACQELY